MKFFLILALILVFVSIFGVSNSFSETQNPIIQSGLIKVECEGEPFYRIFYDVSKSGVTFAGGKETVSISREIENIEPTQTNLVVSRNFVGVSLGSVYEEFGIKLIPSVMYRYFDKEISINSQAIKIPLVHSDSDYSILIQSRTSKNLLDRNCVGINTVDSLWSPRQQFDNGIRKENVLCKVDYELIFKSSDESPACVKPSTAQKLLERGWTELGNLTQIDESQQLSDEDFKRILLLDSSLRLINHQFDYEHKMIKSVQEFRGTDGMGKSITELLRENIEEKYPKSELMNPDTEMGWHGYHADTRSRNDYKVYFTIQTPNEKSEYLWGITIVSEKVYAINPVFNNQEAIDIFYKAEEN